MAVNIHNLIAAVVPDVFCDSSLRKEVKKIVKEQGYRKAAEKAKIFLSGEVGSYDFFKSFPLKNPGLEAPIEQHKVEYDSTTEGIEPIYFWLLDYVNQRFREVEKISDNFVSSVGSGHFSELSQKATIMQREAMNMLGSVNTVLKSILNLLYDLRDFKLRLKPYEKLDSKDKAIKESGIFSLKQVWMDTVDIKRGNGSLNAMAQQLDFVTIRDAFMAAENEKLEYKGEVIDLNERVKRILSARVREFYEWLEESKSELRKRYEIEKRYLQSQVSTLKLYSRWIKPYLDAAYKLEQRASPTAALVSTFNTMLLELTLIVKNKYDPTEDVNEGDLPRLYKDISKKEYYSTIIIEFKFRGIPSRQGQHYTFGGLTEVTFTSYALTKPELDKVKKELDKDDFNEMMSLIEGATNESIEKLQEEIDSYLNEDKVKKEDKAKESKNEEDVNPFSSLFSFLSFSKKDKKDSKTPVEITPDNVYEKTLRSQAIIVARERCYSLFSDLKRNLGMVSHPDPYDSIQ